MCFTREEIAELWYANIEQYEIANENRRDYAESLAFEVNLSIQDIPEDIEPRDNFEFAEGVLDRFTDRNFK